MNNVQLYKKISLDIIKALKKDEVEVINVLLDKRQELLESIGNNSQFIKKLISEGIIDIDKEIKNLLSKSIDKVKIEIKEHKKSIQVSNSYMNISRENINIFNKKV